MLGSIKLLFRNKKWVNRVFETAHDEQITLLLRSAALIFVEELFIYIVWGILNRGNLNLFLYRQLLHIYLLSLIPF